MNNYIRAKAGVCLMVSSEHIMLFSIRTAQPMEPFRSVWAAFVENPASAVWTLRRANPGGGRLLVEGRWRCCGNDSDRSWRAPLKNKKIEGTLTQGRLARRRSEPTLGWNDETALVIWKWLAGSVAGPEPMEAVRHLQHPMLQKRTYCLACRVRAASSSRWRALRIA